MPPHSKFLADSPSQGNSTYPCDREKGTASAVPPVNPWLSSDRASGLGKRQKGKPTPSLLSIYGFHRTAPAVWEKDKRDNLRRSSRQSTAFTRPRQRSEKKDKRDSLRCLPCQSMAFIGPRQRSGKKTKGTTCVVPPVNLRLSSDRASGLGKRQKGQLALSLLSMG